MNSLKNIILLLISFVIFQSIAFSQTDSIKNDAEIRGLKKSDSILGNTYTKLHNRVNAYENNFLESISFKDSIDFEIEKLNQLSSANQKQLETVISISSNTSNQVGNKLDSISLLLVILGIFLSIGGIGLGIYISRKEGDIAQLLLKSDNNLLLQKESEERMIKTREEINKDLTSLYRKLRIEELKDILLRIESDPVQIEVHTSRLLTLDLNSEHFIHLKNLFFTWIKDSMHTGLNTNVTILLIYHFPLDVSANQELLPLMKHHFGRAYSSIGFDKLEIFNRGLINDYFDEKYKEVNSVLLMSLKAMDKYYNVRYIVFKLLFEESSNKANRFRFYNLIKNDHELFFLIKSYQERMIKEYDEDDNNSAIENDLILEMKKASTP